MLVDKLGFLIPSGDPGPMGPPGRHGQRGPKGEKGEKGMDNCHLQGRDGSGLEVLPGHQSICGKR